MKRTASPRITDDPKWCAALSAVVHREAKERAARLKAKRASKLKAEIE